MGAHGMCFRGEIEGTFTCYPLLSGPMSVMEGYLVCLVQTLSNSYYLNQSDELFWDETAIGRLSHQGVHCLLLYKQLIYFGMVERNFS